MSAPHKHTKQIDANVIIANDKVLASDQSLVFGSEEVITLPGDSSMLDVLVAAGIFQSKSQARKTGFVNLRDEGNGFDKLAASDMAVPVGFSELWSGKLKHWVAIWNPAD